MIELSRLWVGMLIDERRNSDTDSPIVLIINETGGRSDVVHYTFQIHPREIKSEDKPIFTR